MASPCTSASARSTGAEFRLCTRSTASPTTWLATRKIGTSVRRTTLAVPSAAAVAGPKRRPKRACSGSNTITITTAKMSGVANGWITRKVR